MASCWTPMKGEMNCAKLSLFMIVSYPEMIGIHLILLEDHWFFDLRNIQQLHICKKLLSSWGAHCPCFIQSEWHIGDTQYLWQNCHYLQLIHPLRWQLFIWYFWYTMDCTISGRSNSFSFVRVAVSLRGHIVPVSFNQICTLATYNTFWHNCQGLLTLQQCLDLSCIAAIAVVQYWYQELDQWHC